MTVASDLTALEKRGLSLLTFTSETLHLEHSRWARSIVSDLLSGLQEQLSDLGQ